MVKKRKRRKNVVVNCIINHQLILINDEGDLNEQEKFAIFL